jgi:hypothetical protein
MTDDRFQLPAIASLVAAFMAVSFVVSPRGAQAQPTRPTRPPLGGAAVDWTAAAPETQSVVLQLDSDTSRGERLMDAQGLVLLAKSTALTDPAIEKAFGRTASEARKIVTIDAVPAGSRLIQLTIILRNGDPQPPAGAAKALLQELCDRLKAAVAQSSKMSGAAFEAKKASLEADLTAARDRLEKASAALKAARASSPAAGNVDSRYALQSLIQQKQQLELNLTGMKVRLKTIQENMPAAPSAPPTTTPSPQASSAATARLIDLRTRKLEQVKASAAKQQATDADISDAEASLAEAQALAELIGSVQRPRVFGSYEAGAGDLSTLKANIAENEARLAVIKEQIAAIPQNAPDATSPEQLNRLSNDENRAQNEVSSLQTQLSELTRNARGTMPPTLTVLDGR